MEIYAYIVLFLVVIFFVNFYLISAKDSSQEDRNERERHHRKIIETQNRIDLESKKRKDFEVLTDLVKSYIDEKEIAESLNINFFSKNTPPDFINHEFTVIDFETANRDPLSAISLGVAHFRGNKLLDVKEFRFYPVVNSPWIFQDIHNISYDEIKLKPTFENQWDKIYPHLSNRLLVAHNAEFDINILQSHINHINKTLKNIKVACTFNLSKKFLPTENSYSLKSLCKEYKIPYWNHIAAYDAVSAGALFIYLISEAPAGALRDTSMRGKTTTLK